MNPDDKKRKQESQRMRKKWAKQVLAWFHSPPPVPTQMAITDKGTGKDLGKTKNKGKNETRANWNQRVGSCAAEGPCRYGRKHVCSRCGGDHKLLDCESLPTPRRCRRRPTQARLAA